MKSGVCPGGSAKVATLLVAAVVGVVVEALPVVVVVVPCRAVVVVVRWCPGDELQAARASAPASSRATVLGVRQRDLTAIR